MKTLTCLSLWAATFLAAPFVPSHTESPEQPRVKVTELMRRPDPHDEKRELITVRLDFVPGATSPAHMHHGFIAGYVQSGRFDFQLEGGPLLHLKAGDTFYEAPGSHHLVTKNPDAELPAVVIAFTVQPKGVPVAVPLPAAAEVNPH